MKYILHNYWILPENIRLVLMAIFGALLGWVIYELIYIYNPFEPRATSSWILAFILGVARQHALHRWLTFQSKSSYWKSLMRAYVMYSTSLILGTILNFILINHFNFNHRIAWLACLGLTACISLFFLRNYVFKKT